MNKLEDIRNNFTKMRGGRLISAEAYILGIITCFILTVAADINIYAAFAAALAVGFVFPILIGVFKSLAWFAAVLFSFIWALFAFVCVKAAAGGTAGFFAGIIFFAVSFIVHKNYSGLSAQIISRKNRDSQVSSKEEISSFEDVSFCPKCGRRIRTSDGSCEICDR